MYIKIKKFYDMGLYSKEQVEQFAERGHITQEQYREITGGAPDGTA